MSSHWVLDSEKPGQSYWVHLSICIVSSRYGPISLSKGSCQECPLVVPVGSPEKTKKLAPKFHDPHRTPLWKQFVMKRVCYVNHISSPKSYTTCKYDGESFFPEHLEWNVPPSGNFVLGGSTRTCKTRPASSIRSFNSRSRLYQTSRVSRFRVEKRSKPKDGMMNSNARHCMYPLEYSKPVIFGVLAINPRKRNTSQENI